MIKHLSRFLACFFALFLTSCMPFSFWSSDEVQPDSVAAQETVKQASADEAQARPAIVQKGSKGAKVKADATSSPSRKTVLSEEKVRAELDAFLVSYTSKTNKSMNGSRANPMVTSRKGMYVAHFTEIDPASVHADMRKSKSKHFDYVASMYYVETTYECIAKTKKAALKGPFKVIRVRNLTELPRYYKGKWEN